MSKVIIVLFGVTAAIIWIDATIRRIHRQPRSADDGEKEVAQNGATDGKHSSQAIQWLEALIGFIVPPTIALLLAVGLVWVIEAEPFGRASPSMEQYSNSFDKFVRRAGQQLPAEAFEDHQKELGLPADAILKADSYGKWGWKTAKDDWILKLGFLGFAPWVALWWAAGGDRSTPVMVARMVCWATGHCVHFTVNDPRPISQLAWVRARAVFYSRYVAATVLAIAIIAELTIPVQRAADYQLADARLEVDHFLSIGSIRNEGLTASRSDSEHDLKRALGVYRVAHEKYANAAAEAAERKRAPVDAEKQRASYRKYRETTKTAADIEVALTKIKEGLDAARRNGDATKSKELEIEVMSGEEFLKAARADAEAMWIASGRGNPLAEPLRGLKTSTESLGKAIVRVYHPRIVSRLESVQSAVWEYRLWWSAMVYAAYWCGVIWRLPADT